MSRILFTVAALALSACAATYEPTKHNGEPLAKVSEYGGNFTCGPLDGKKICRARVNRVDGVRDPVEIQPGLRQLDLSCTTKPGISFPLSVPNNQYILSTVEAELKPGGQYSVQAEWMNDQCRMTIIDTATGQPLQVKHLDPRLPSAQSQG
jgi:hypothetical protein